MNLSKYAKQKIADTTLTEAPDDFKVKLYYELLPNILKRLVNAKYPQYSGEIEELASQMYDELFGKTKVRRNGTSAQFKDADDYDLDDPRLINKLTNYVDCKLLDKNRGGSGSEVIMSEKYDEGTGSQLDAVNQKSAGGYVGTEATADMGSQSGAYVAEDDGLLGKVKHDLEDAIFTARDNWDDMTPEEKKHAARIYKSTRKKLQADDDDLDPAVVEIFEDLLRDPEVGHVPSAADDSPTHHFHTQRVKLKSKESGKWDLDALKVSGCASVPNIPGWKYYKTWNGNFYFVPEQKD